MGLITGFETDVFISYAHIDNEPMLEGKPGWVSFFEDLLRKRLRIKLGQEVALFRDAKLRGVGEFDDQLMHQLVTSAVIVSIVTPRYVQSDWCLRELREFTQRHGTARVIKVVKSPIENLTLSLPAQTLLRQVENVLDFRFYQKDESSGLYDELEPARSKDLDAFFSKVDVIAQQLAELFRQLRRTGPLSAPTTAAVPAPSVAAASPPEAAATDDSAGTVYLATTDELTEERQRIQSELEQFKYRVVPAQPLPTDEEEFAAAVQAALAEAKLAVHLLGAKYGTRLGEEERSIAHVQYDLAAALAQQGKLRQVAWLPSALTPKPGRQEDFVNFVKGHTPAFLQTTLEDLKTELQQQLTATNNKAEDEASAQISVSLFCHEADFPAIKKLYSYLKLSEAYKVRLPLEDGASLEKHKQILQSSDAVLLYYGTANEDWFENIWRLVLKHSAAGRVKPILARAIYTGMPETFDKQMLEGEDPLVIKNFNEFQPAVLQPFLDKLRVAQGRAK